MDTLQEIKKQQLVFFELLKKEKQKHNISKISNIEITTHWERFPYRSTMHVMFSDVQNFTFEFTLQFSDKTNEHQIDIFVFETDVPNKILFVSHDKETILEETKEYWFPFYQYLYHSFNSHFREMPEIRMKKLFTDGPKTYEEMKDEVFFL